MGAFIVNPESEYSKEMAKWEQRDSRYTIGLPIGRPYQFVPYPAMLYQARQLPNGKYAVAQEPPLNYGFRDMSEWDRAVQQAASFTTSCQRTVGTQEEHKRARADGWRDTPAEAMEFRDQLDKMVGDAAAERNHQDRNMSEKARAESAVAESEHFGHLGEIPEKRRGRKPGPKPKGSAPGA